MNSWERAFTLAYHCAKTFKTRTRVYYSDEMGFWTFCYLGTPPDEDRGSPSVR